MHSNFAPFANPSRYLMPLITAMAVLAYGLVIEWYFGWGKLLAAWAPIPVWQPLLALILMFATYLVRALRIYDYFLMRDANPVSISAQQDFLLCCQITLMHNLLNNLLPMRTGEASFPLLMRSHFAIPLARSTSGLVFLRVLDIQVLFCIGWLAVVFYAGTAPWLWWSLFPLVLAPLSVLPLVPVVRGWQGRARQPWLNHLLQELLAAVPANFGMLVRAWLLTWLNWGTKLAVFALVLRWFVRTDWWSAIVICIGGELSSVLPVHAPGGLGTYEASMLAAASLLGLSGDSILFAGVQLHLLIILSTLIGGMLALCLPRPDLSESLRLPQN